MNMAEHNDRPWLNIFLGLLCIGAIVAAYASVGEASQSATRTTTTATVAKGIVQSTVSGSGNIQAASELDLGFKTGGTVTHIYVTQGEHVLEGQLLATLNPQSAEVSLEQAKATLLTAEANLAQEEENDGETSAAQNTANTGTQAAKASAARSLQIAYPATEAATAPTTTTPTTSAPGQASEPTASTTPATTAAASAPASSSPSATSTAPGKTEKQKAESKSSKTSGSSSAGSKSSEGSSSSSATISSATREANLASATAAVKSDKLTVQSDEEAVQDTELRAPADGTIVALSGEVGETVSGSGTTKASSTSSSSAGTGSTSGAGAGSSSAASSSGSSASAASSSFAVLSDLSSLQLVVPLSESEVLNVHAGQIATVTIEALGSRKVAAHVLNVASLSTSNSGVVSYDVTFQLDQTESGLKPGMSATAEVVVKQAEGVNVPTSAISGDTVTVISGGKQIRRSVTTGLAGDSSTIILSGLQAGEEISLPLATSTSSSTSSLRSRSRTGGALGTGGFAGGGFAGAGGGFAGRGGGAP